MQGLQLLVRLMRHHPETVHTQLHSVIVAVAKQVRNLRSQVARAACQASGERNRVRQPPELQFW